MASSRVTLSVDRDHYRAARAAAARLDTTVSHLTDLFFQSLASSPDRAMTGISARLRGAFRSTEVDDSRALVAALKAKHLG